MDRRGEIPKSQRIEAASLQVGEEIDVPRGLGHLHAVDEKVLAVHPSTDVRVAERCLALRNLALVMGEDVIYPAGVEVVLLAQITGADGRTFNMPAGEAGPPGTLPDERAARFGGLPEGEVTLVALEGIRRHAAALLRRLTGLTREFAVSGKPGYVEVDVTAGFIGVAISDEALYETNHVGHKVGGTGEGRGGQNA
jgi:hypothetical protein